MTQPKPVTLPPLAYIRVGSFTRSRPAASLDAQRAELTAYAAVQGSSIPEFFEDVSRAGRADIRPGLEALLSTLKPGQTVLTSSLATIGQQDGAATLACLDRILAVPARLVTLREHIDTDNPTTMDLRAILSAMDTVYRERSSAHNIEGRAEALKQGSFPLGKQSLPYGYTKNSEGQVVLSEQSRAREVFLLKPGRGMKQLSAELARLGILTPAGGPVWAPNTLRNLLTNTAYKGELVYGQKSHPDEPDRWVRMPVPALVSEEEWQAAQLDTWSKSSLSNPGKYPLTGHLKCACGASLMGTIGRKQQGGLQYRYYGCLPEIRKTPTCISNGKRSRFWRADPIDSQARQQLEEVLGHLDAPEHEGLFLIPRGTAMNAERAALQEQLRALTDMRQRGLIELADYASRQQTLTSRLGELGDPPPLPVAEGIRDAQLVSSAGNEELAEMLMEWGVTFGLNAFGDVRLLTLQPRGM